MKQRMKIGAMIALLSVPFLYTKAFAFVLKMQLSSGGSIFMCLVLFLIVLSGLYYGFGFRRRERNAGNYGSYYDSEANELSVDTSLPNGSVVCMSDMNSNMG